MYNKSALLIIFLLLYNVSSATVYYVDDISGNNVNSGTTTSTAWKTIAKVNAMTFAPGDQILFKKGGIWYESLTIKSSGTSSSPIIYGAYGSGNYPVIDGSYSRSNCIYLYGKNNVIIQNFKLQNATGSGQVRVCTASNVKVSDNQIFVTGHGGVFIENSSYCIVSRNSITTPSGSFDIQTDGIYSQRNSYNTYDGNSIVITNTAATPHVDGIQSYIDKSLTLKNNYIFQNNNKTFNSQGIYATTGSGTHIYFNNVVNCPNTISAVIGFRNLTAGTGTVRVYHNTLIGRGGSVLYVTEDPNLIAKNNIFIATLTGAEIIKLTTINSFSNVNNNLYYNGGGTRAGSYNGSIKTFSQWQALGLESNGVLSNPGLESNYTLKAVSGAINKGIDLGTAYKFDKGGRLRPQMNGTDIGAYESMYVLKDNGDNTGDQSPVKFDLSQNYPNPFNPSTQIRYSLATASEVTLKIYDILGKEVATLVNETKGAGDYQVQFDGSSLSSGVYIYQLKTASFVESKKMTLVK